MVRTRKERKAETIPFRQPDRSGPTEATLLELAQERNLFDEADRQQGKPRKRRVSQGGDADDEDEDEDEDAEIPPTVERVMETVLWSVSLAMLHFAFDVLVQRQYAMQISWHQIVTRTLQAFVGELHIYEKTKHLQGRVLYLTSYLANRCSPNQCSLYSSTSSIPISRRLS